MEAAREDNYLKLQDAAREFSIPLRQLRLASDGGELKTAKVGRACVVRREEVAAWLRKLESRKG